jgi:hypothetical protein
MSRMHVPCYYHNNIQALKFIKVLASLSILLLLTICGSFLSLAFVNGQEDLVNYTNGEMNFAFQHPSNWQVTCDKQNLILRFVTYSEHHRF